MIKLLLSVSLDKTVDSSFAGEYGGCSQKWLARELIRSSQQLVLVFLFQIWDTRLVNGQVTWSVRICSDDCGTSDPRPPAGLVSGLGGLGGRQAPSLPATK